MADMQVPDQHLLQNSPIIQAAGQYIGDFIQMIGEKLDNMTAAVKDMGRGGNVLGGLASKASNAYSVFADKISAPSTPSVSQQKEMGMGQEPSKPSLSENQSLNTQLASAGINVSHMGMSDVGTSAGYTPAAVVGANYGQALSASIG